MENEELLWLKYKGVWEFNENIQLMDSGRCLISGTRRQKRYIINPICSDYIRSAFGLGFSDIRTPNIRSFNSPIIFSKKNLWRFWSLSLSLSNLYNQFSVQFIHWDNRENWRYLFAAICVWHLSIMWSENWSFCQWLIFRQSILNDQVSDV